jgi:phosphate transport system protein
MYTTKTEVAMEVSMSRTPRRTNAISNHGRDTTLAEVIEMIDQTAPETKAELAETMDLSEHYLSELLQELKDEDVICKGYVVDREAAFDAAPSISKFNHGGTEAPGPKLLTGLARLEDVTTNQYEAAMQTYVGETPERTADDLEPLTNERCFAVLNELKSFTITTDWPGNRVAADLTTIARNFEIIGDRACFIADVTTDTDGLSDTVVRQRVVEIFETGIDINESVQDILFESELARIEDLYEKEEQVHRDLSELVEMATAHDAEFYGTIVAITRALERIIYYWLHTAEVAVRLHAGVELEHLTLHSNF